MSEGKGELIPIRTIGWAASTTGHKLSISGQPGKRCPKPESRCIVPPTSTQRSGVNMRVLAAAIAAAALAAPSYADFMDWQKEIVKANVAWADKPRAILKIDDAVYLKDGQSAYLTHDGDVYKWSMTQPKGLVPTVRFEKGKALVRMLGQTGDLDLLTAPDSVLKLNDKVEIFAAITQIQPSVSGLRVLAYNQDNKAAKEFAGLEYYPYSKKYVVTADFVATPSPVAEDFQTSRGWWKRFYRVGEAVFKLDGKEQRLPFYAGDADPAKIKEMSAFFMDQLTGKETYGVGRYLDIPVKDGLPQTLTIDFNYAYNPNCARSPHYNCPQAKVTLSADLRAGERKPRTFPDH
jgi:uncharacterized protein (DUF1684 family)